MWIKISFGVLLLLIINVAAVHAQAPSCSCGCIDPDATCPLDTWVIVLAAAAFIFATLKLYRKQSAQQQYAAGGRQD